VLDLWRRDSPHWDAACAQAAALVLYGADILDAHPTEWRHMLAVGQSLVRKDAKTVARNAREAYRFSTVYPRRTSVAIIATSNTSDTMEAMKDTVDVVLGFQYRCDDGIPKMVVSCRSPSVDVSEFARAHGGGGPKPAAGFTVTSCDKAGHQPYFQIQSMWEEFLEDQYEAQIR
jgi:nanoRNase/pAp phosphatase (c-di-AMP/oligoRNAs hydrolase)